MRISGEVCILFAKSPQQYRYLCSNFKIFHFSSTFLLKETNSGYNFQKNTCILLTNLLLLRKLRNLKKTISYHLISSHLFCRLSANGGQQENSSESGRKPIRVSGGLGASPAIDNCSITNRYT